MKKIGLLLFALLTIITLSACGAEALVNTVTGGSQYISVVKDGNFYDYPDDYVGDAFDDFFHNPTWEYFLSDDEEHIVEFNGEATYLDEDVNICIQFEINLDTEEFEVIWSDINEYEMSTLDYNDMMDTIFGY